MIPVFYERRLRDRVWLVWPIVAFAALLRFVVVGRDTFWLDEGYSWWDARQPLAALWGTVTDCDPHPPLYFALLHGWIAIAGEGTVAMRVVSIVFGCATVAAVFMAGRELDRMRGAPDARFGIAPIAAVCFALTPFQIYFSIEARPYALLCFAAALVTWGALRLLRVDTAGDRLRRFDDGPTTGLGWLLIVVGTTIALWTNNTAVLFVGALATFFVALWLVDRSGRRTIWPIVAAGIVVALLWAADLPLLLRQLHEVSSDFWIPRPTWRGLNGELRFTIGLDAYDATWWLVAAMLGGVVMVGRRLSWRLAGLLAALAILPVAFNVAISLLMSPILIARALITIAPAFTIALVAGAVLVRSPKLRAVLVLGLLAAHIAAASKFFITEHMKEPWRPIVARLAVVAKDATVLVVPNELALPLGHEAQVEGLALRVRGIPADYPAIGMPLRYPSGKCAPTAAKVDPKTVLAATGGEQAVVLVTRRNNLYDPEEDVPAALRSLGYTLESEDLYQPGDLRVMRFVQNRTEESK